MIRNFYQRLNLKYETNINHDRARNKIRDFLKNIHFKENANYRDRYLICLFWNEYEIKTGTKMMLDVMLSKKQQWKIILRHLRKLNNAWIRYFFYLSKSLKEFPKI